MQFLWQKVRSFYSNLSLKKKMVTIVTVSICMISLASFAGLRVISKAHTRLLEESVANNLSYSAATISDYLNHIETLSGTILADSTLQSNLITMSNGNAREQAAAYQNLSKSIQQYYDQSKSFHVDYITLYTLQNTIYSNFLGNRRTPEHIESSILALSEAQEGRPVWTFSYAEENGFYLGRQIRNFQSPYFAPIGTVIISVDLEQMLRTINQREGAFPDAQYFIASNGEIIYRKEETTSAIYDKMASFPDNQYQVLTVNGHKYFVYSTSIPGRELVYTCYISYDSIFHSASLAWIFSLLIILLTCLIAFIFSQSMIAFINRQTQILVQKMQAYHVQENVPDGKSDYAGKEQPPEATHEALLREDEFGLLNRQFDHMADRIRNLVQVNYVNELWKKESQLKALEKQIQPHFLYNTLESINWRAKAAGNTDISHMVESLGSLLRASLSKDTEKWNLQKELEILDSYITIQKYRFEEHLDYVSYCPASLLDTRIPKFIIQPLVENAIHYGLEECMETCHIEVTVQLDESAHILHIYVKNDGSQFEEDLLAKLRSAKAQSRGLGIGLINIDDRTRLMFGTSYGLTLYNEGENAVARISIPYTGADCLEDTLC